MNTQQVQKVLTYLIPYDDEKVPTEPRPDLAPISTLDNSMLQTINKLRALYEIQPAWTRRGLRNNLTTDEDRTNLRHAVPYVGYIFRSGPWRDAIIKLGVDPRTSPEYRHYQTFMFRLLAREAEVARDGASGRRHNLPRPYDLHNAQLHASGQTTSLEDGTSNTHIFTGKLPFSADGKIWMISEIQDPQLKEALYPTEAPEGFLREECEIVADGWYGNGTLGKVKTVMRHKIQALMEGREPNDEEFEKVMRLPDHARCEADFEKFTFDGEPSSREMQLATEVRSAIRGSPLWTRLPGNRGVGRGKARGKGKEREEQWKGKGKAGKAGRGGRGRKGKEVAFEEPDVEVEVEGDAEEQIDEPSEGEEEEIQRREMLAEQVAAAAEARDADQDDDESENSDEDGSD
jgi:general transcription factor 3C polypeptide 5 (transcription factor C subunit 1)